MIASRRTNSPWTVELSGLELFETALFEGVENCSINRSAVFELYDESGWMDKAEIQGI